jgi:hypothetical protein
VEIEQWRQKYRTLSAVRMPEAVRTRVSQALSSACVTERAQGGFRLTRPWLKGIGIAALAGIMILLICQFGPLNYHSTLLTAKSNQSTGQSATAPLLGTNTDQKGQQNGQPGMKSGQEDASTGGQVGKTGDGATINAMAAPCIRPYVLWNQRFYRLDTGNSAVDSTVSLVGQHLGSYLNAEIYRIEECDPQQRVAVMVGSAGPFPAEYAYPRLLHWNGLDYELNPNEAPEKHGNDLGKSGEFNIYAVPGKSPEREVAVGQQGRFFVAVHE